MNRNYGKHSHADTMKSGNHKGGAQKPRGGVLVDRESLAKFRVIQRDLIYVIGIPMNIAHEEILEKYEYFGHYGEIKKIVVNQTPYTNTYQKPTVSAYITFVNVDDALECLYALEGFTIGGHAIKASFGTSKYCSSFLAGQKCNKPDCMYLHYTGLMRDSFSTEEIQQNSKRFVSMTRPMRPDDYYEYEFFDNRPTIFPPKRNLNERIDNEYDEYEYMFEEEEHVESSKNREFRNKLFTNNYFNLLPLKVNYTVGQSLNEQLDLTGRNPIRYFCRKEYI